MFKLRVVLSTPTGEETITPHTHLYTIDELFTMDIPTLVNTLKELYGDKYISSYFVSNTI